MRRAWSGALGKKNSCIFYLRRQSVVAYCAFKARQRDLAAFNRIIKSATRVSPDQVSDLAIEPMQLLRKPN
jgi:hypothetical protein